ncbi:hypothetical protein FC19_GL000276 [Liquorilactobacillus aquaticus DSM 21051]|uniref:Arabinogalactan endo-beta-1,4-galactanase n=1 Tax=Liquorilactobacillus aquaticus DSM 21051 TaxID=1423725 RepID=A0A0R2CY62_9LACO|nr:glycosyl hydrolase 53 family protein [Liquorilactobacillus aquaticus]KRM96760.1 hypothetical protein FC19_GL000276 [Liquorilactobacillus aquaticus DSM 21051]
MVEYKLHYKMYKAGKNWIYAALTTIALGIAFVSDNSIVKADTVTTTVAAAQNEPTTGKKLGSSTAASTEEAAASNSSDTQEVQNNVQTLTKKDMAASDTSSTVQASETAATDTKTATTKAGKTTQDVQAPSSREVDKTASSNSKSVASVQTSTRQMTDETANSSENQKSSVKTVKAAVVVSSDKVNTQTQSSVVQTQNDKKTKTITQPKTNLIQKQENGNWYIYDADGKYQVGFQKIVDQNKTVYYNNQGQMQYGQQQIQNNWYLFDKNTGAMQTGFQNIPEQKKKVYYNDQGQMQYGQQQIQSKWYLFDKNTGAMKTGFQNIPEQRKTVYYNGQGQMQYGQQQIQSKWYLFDNKTGAMMKGLQYILGQNKMVYYNNQGQMIYGTQKVNGHLYVFNRATGALNVKPGQQWIDGHWYLFSKRLAMQTGFQNIVGQKKTVYYNAQGQMQYGQQRIQNNWYLFDKNTGAMQTGFQNISDQKKTVYYNNQGRMQYGQQRIQNNWYLFDKNTGAMQTGFQNISDQKKTAYYNNQGRMQYGQQRIQNNWYLFDKNTGAMQTGFQNISDQKKTVYYNDQGQMLYAWQIINNDKYYFDKNTGALTTGTVRIDGDKYDFDKNGVLLDQSKYDIKTYRELTANDINSKLEQSGQHSLNVDLSNSQDNYAAFSLHDGAQLIAQGDLSDETTAVEEYLRKNANMTGTATVYRANVTAANAVEAAQKTSRLFADWYNGASDFSWTSLGIGGVRDLDNKNGWTSAMLLYKAVPDTTNVPSAASSKIVYRVGTVYGNEAITASKQEQLQEGMTVSEAEVDNSDNNEHLENILQGRLGQKISTDSLKVIANSIGGMTTVLVGTKQYLDGNGQAYHYEFWLDGQTAVLKEENFVNDNIDASYGNILVANVSATAIYEKEQSVPNAEIPTSKMTSDQITAAYQTGTETGLKYENVNIKPIEGMKQDTIRGVDISSYIALKNAGVQFYDFDGKKASLIKVLHDAGVNYLRLRIWNDPYDSQNNSYGGGASDEANMLAIAREASQYGMKLAIDFQYSDFWTDPGKQVVPKAWRNLTNSELEQAVYLYTKKVMSDFKGSGADVGMVQIGNEITNGLLGIVASRDQGESYANIWNNAQSAGKISDYLVAGAHAVRESTPDAKVVIHIETPNIDKYSAIMTALKNNGVDYDVLGSSYYPFWSTGTDNGHGLGRGANTPANLAAVEKMVQEKYGKQFVILETGWVNSLQDADGTGNSISSNTNAYTVGPQGQVDAMREMYQVLVKQGGLGAFYWEPAWIPVKAGWDNWQYNKSAADLYGTGWASKYAVGYAPDNVMYYQGQPAWGGTTWDNVTLFDDHGYPLQSLKAFKGFLKS